MSTLKDELASIDEQIEQLEERRRAIYAESLMAPDAEKICEDSLSRLLAEPDLVKPFKYPVSVTGVHIDGELVAPGRSRKVNRLVRVRPCGEDFGGKTYLGLYLGDVARTVGCSYDPESGVLSFSLSMQNPALWIPSLWRVVYGYESWWGVLESEDQLREISNESIDGIWYVQAMRALVKGEDEVHAQG
jgi:hypothetical protein